MCGGNLQNPSDSSSASMAEGAEWSSFPVHARRLPVRPVAGGPVSAGTARPAGGSLRGSS